jgi:metal-responsive CopG/Arc/MetJ family transcriptional regulator
VLLHSLSTRELCSLTGSKQQKDKPSRSEAIRRLIEFALAAKSKKHSGGNR